MRATGGRPYKNGVLGEAAAVSAMRVTDGRPYGGEVSERSGGGECYAGGR